MTEEWRDVPGYEGRYRVSSLGRVRSLLRGGRELRPGRCSTGYMSVALTHGGGGRTGRSHMVQYLVAAAFIGPRPRGMLVMHEDGTRDNNAASNLRYGSYTENAHDRARHGRRKFTLQQIADMRRLHASGVTPIAIRKAFGVNPTCIYKILKRKSYAHG